MGGTQFGIPPKQISELAYTGSDIALVPIVESSRAPTVNDKNYPIDCLWRETTLRTLYWLSGFDATGALWIPLGGGAGALNTLTDTAGNIVLPVGANIQLASVTTNLVIAKNGNGLINFSIGNQVSGTAQTIGAVTANPIVFPMGATPGTYQINCRVAAFCSIANGGPLSAGYELVGAIRTTGAAGVIIGTIDKVVNEEGALTAGDAYVVIAGNSMVIQVLGTAGKTINWKADLTYTFVS